MNKAKEIPVLPPSLSLYIYIYIYIIPALAVIFARISLFFCIPSSHFPIPSS